MYQKNNLRILWSVLALSLFITLSCKHDEDYTDPEQIKSSIWKCSDGKFEYDIEYVLLRFTSKTDVEGWSKIKTAELTHDWSGNFQINGNRITIITGNQGDTLTGTILQKSIYLMMDNDEYLFEKQ